MTKAFRNGHYPVRRKVQSVLPVSCSMSVSSPSLKCPCSGFAEEVEAVYVKRNLRRRVSACAGSQHVACIEATSKALEEEDYASDIAGDLKAETQGNKVLVSYDKEVGNKIEVVADFCWIAWQIWKYSFCWNHESAHLEFGQTSCGQQLVYQSNKAQKSPFVPPIWLIFWAASAKMMQRLKRFSFASCQFAEIQIASVRNASTQDPTPHASWCLGPKPHSGKRGDAPDRPELGEM